MIQNFMNIDQKGNYFIITTGWIDSEIGEINYTGQFDFPKDATTFMAYKNLDSTEITNTGVAIVCGMPFKRLNIRAEMLTRDEDGNNRLIPNIFRLDGMDVTFEEFVIFLYLNTGKASA
jgi:hypothetical protein